MGGTAYLTPQYYGEGFASIKATNSCGTTHLCQTICVDGCDFGLQTFPTAPCFTQGLCGMGMMSVYPNPSSDDIIISLEAAEADEHYTVVIRDDRGQQVHQQEFHGQELRLTKGLLKAGTYYITVYHAGTRINTETLIMH